MRRSQYLLLLLLIPTLVFGQRASKLKNPTRSIEYYSLNSAENASFHRFKQEIFQYFHPFYNDLEIQAYDLIGKDTPIPISNDTVLKRLISGSYPTEELTDDGRVLNEDRRTFEYYMRHQVNLIGLDVLKAKGRKHITFIHFFVGAKFNSTRVPKYICSYEYSDVDNLLKEKGAIYYSLKSKAFWKKGILASDLFRNSFAYFYKMLTGAQLSEEDQYKNYGVTLEEHVDKSGNWVTDSVKFLVDNNDNSPRYQVMTSIDMEAKEAELDGEATIYYFTDAIKAGLLRRIENPTMANEDLPLIENYKPRDYSEIEDLSKVNFTMRMAEVVYLDEGINQRLQRPGRELVSILLDSIRTGAIETVYEPFETLEEKMDNPSGIFNRLYIYNPDFLNPMAMHMFKEEYEWLSSDQQTQLKKEIVAAGYADSTRLFFQPPGEIALLKIIYDVSFNGMGENKQYEIAGIEIGIPANYNEARYDESLLGIGVEDLTNVLIGNPYAEIVVNDQLVNYLDILKSRELEKRIWSIGPIRLKVN